MANSPQVNLNNGKKEFSMKESLTSFEFDLEDLNQIVSFMKDPEKGVPRREKRTLFILYKNVFEGETLVDWILNRLCFRTREECVVYAQRLLDKGLITGVNFKKKFEDSSSLYRFGKEVAQTEQLVQSEKPVITGVNRKDFEEVSVLGKGTFGKVLLVKKKDTQKEYAMKLITKENVINEPHDFKNLMTEKKILQNDCPFLVHLHFAFQTEKEFVLVMDYLGGGDLWFHLKQLKVFPENFTQFIIAELVIALSYLHKNDIIYRDLKPHNVLLDMEGHISLADFGLAREVTHQEPGLYTACGTPVFSAPEVLEGREYDKNVDWWGLGILTFMLLIGKPPFQFRDGDFLALLKQVTQGISAVQFPTHVSNIAKDFIVALLQNDPKQRLSDPEKIKQRSFFGSLDWEKLEKKKLTSPIKISSETKTIQTN